MHCDYKIKGIVEYNDKIKEIHTVQFSFIKECGGFEFEYYFNNIYYLNDNNDIIHYNNYNHPLLIWAQNNYSK